MSLTAAPLHTFSTIDRRDIDMSPAMSELTVAQAARLIDVSEGLVDELLKAKRVVFRLDDGERLIERNSLVDYWQERERRRASFAEMVRMNQEMGLYDDD